MRVRFGVDGFLILLLLCFGGGGGNLVPRRDKEHFYILELVTGNKGKVVEGDQVYVCAYLFLIIK